MIHINHFKLGLFFVVCIGVVLGLLIWIGASHLFRHTHTYATFFEESVQGLGRGSAVFYLGVKVGEVSDIKLTPHERLVMVLMDLQPDFKVSANMAAELQLLGITGKRSISIVMAPPDTSKVTPVVRFAVKYPVIPSHPGEMRAIETAMEKLFHKVESADIGGLAAAWKETAVKTNRILLEKDLPETLHNIRKTSAELESMVAELKGSGTITDLHRGVEDFASTAADTQKTGEYLKNQIQAVPPDAFARFAEKMDRIAENGESAVSSWTGQMDYSMTLLQQSVFRSNQVLRDAQGLVDSLREEPGRVLVLPGKKEPFGR